MEPGYGGFWPGDPNAKRHKVTVRSKATGQEYVCMVPEDRYMFFVFEEEGIDLPIINKERMCRQGGLIVLGLMSDIGFRIPALVEIAVYSCSYTVH